MKFWADYNRRKERQFNSRGIRGNKLGKWRVGLRSARVWLKGWRQMSCLAAPLPFAEALRLRLGEREKKLEAWAGIEPAIELLQSSALPLGYHALV